MNGELKPSSFEPMCRVRFATPATPICAGPGYATVTYERLDTAITRNRDSHVLRQTNDAGGVRERFRYRSSAVSRASSMTMIS